MAENSKIQWTDHTFNPWQGCTKVSPGCTNCYAEARDKRWHKGIHWGKGAPRLLKKDWSEPVRWNAKQQWVCDKCGCTVNDPESLGMPFTCPECQYVLSPKRPRVFCASLADWLDDEVPIEWLARLLKLIHDTPNLDWLLLTKRPENWHSRIDAAGDWHFDHGDRNTTGWLCDWWKHKIAPANVWIGTTVEDQKRADERIPLLLEIPAKVRFLSVEPMLEAVEFSDVTRRSDAVLQVGKKALDGIHWVIFGGESGPKSRPCNVDWIRDGVRQCRTAGVAPFVKQLGAHACQKVGPFGSDPLTPGWFDGKAWHKLKDKKGGDISEWPPDLRIREFPKL